MKYLNLDTPFTPFGKSIEFESFVFNGGEPHIKILEKLTAEDELTITTRIRSFTDVGLLLIATDALRRMEVEKIHLVIPYFPAARQDRVMVAGESLSVKVYADIINAQNYRSVTILDAHSEVTPALLNRVKNISNHQFVTACLRNEKDYTLISPDGGALKKVYKLSQFLNGVPVIECSKMRDVKTGKLSGFKVYADDLEGKTCVIVDDICDGGGTFLGLAKELKEKNCGKLILIVTHGIFSKGLDKLTEIFDEIFSTNSFSDIENALGFNQISLNEKILS
ncbi:MAG: ribose-phosphate diphosphokinase [Saprospiraceae bacterium]